MSGRANNAHAHRPLRADLLKSRGHLRRVMGTVSLVRQDGNLPRTLLLGACLILDRSSYVCCVGTYISRDRGT